MINSRMLVALRDPRLTVSEKLRVEFFLAMTLAHELAHVCCHAADKMLHPKLPSGEYESRSYPSEPFFEDDYQAETG